MSRSYNLIDADGHVLEPFTLWNDYMDPQYRERAPKLVKDKNGKERLLLEEKILGSQAGFGGIGGVGARQGVVAADAMEYKDGRKGGFDPHARIPDMDLDGIDAAFLYPSLGLFAGAVTDPGFAAAMCRAYNRWLADYCKPYPDRLFGIAMLPMQSIEAAIGEMRFARNELGFRGGFLRPNPYNHPKLRVGFLESGGGWIAPWLDRMDRHFDDQGFNDSGLKTRPSELFQRNCWISFEPVEGSLKVLADYIGPHKIMWATDYPHPDGFFPGAPDMVKKQLEGTSPETRRQVLGGGGAGKLSLSPPAGRGSG